MLYHRTFFPFIVISMTLALTAAIYFLFQEQFSSRVTTEPAVTTVEYQSAVRQAINDVPLRLGQATDDAQRVVLLEESREELLGLLVPAEYKDLHLAMVLILTEWIQGYQGDEAKRVDSEGRWSTLVEQYPWIE